MEELQIERKYLVLKMDDIRKYLTEEERTHLYILSMRVAEGRLDDKKPINSYLVVNIDEPYAGEVHRLIAGEAAKEAEGEENNEKPPLE